MEKNKLDEYKNKLQAERGLVEREIKLNEHPAPFNVEGDRDDLEEEADQEDAFSNQVALVGDLNRRLVDIDAALQKLTNGTFGVCEKCGGKIDEEVLDIDPESRLCRECKLSV